MIKKVFITFFILISFNVFSKNKLSSHIKLSVEKYQLENGLTVLLNSDKKMKTASYILGYKVGSRHEKKGITGISHMFEHLLSRGTKKYPNFDKSYAQEGVISVNAFTSRDYTAYHARFPPDKLELVLDVESDRMSKLILTQEELDVERGAVQEERKLRYDNNPYGLLSENLMLLSFKNQSYRFPIIGFEEDIANYSLKDLKNWYETYYSPNNAVLVISGNFSINKAKKLIEKYFKGLPAKEIPQEQEWIPFEQKEARKKTLTEKIQSALVNLSFLGPPRGTKEFYALDFLSYLLGRGESSFLYKKLVREKKLLTTIFAWNYDLIKSSLLVIEYPLQDVNKEQEIQNSILNSISEALDTALNQKTIIEKTKNIILNETLLSLRRSSSRARVLLDYEISFNDYTRLYQRIDELDSMSLNFLQLVGQKYLKKERMNYVILKPESYEKN